MKNLTKKSKSPKTKGWHESGSPMGSGDFYGTGIRQKMGRVRSGMGMDTLTNKQVGKPPKKLA
jgi:hypothetical protein